MSSLILASLFVNNQDLAMFCKILENFKGMKRKKLTQQQILEKQKIESRKFNKVLFFSFFTLLLATLFTMVFFTYWCDTKFFYRKYALYGKEIPHQLICMNGNKLEYHESSKIIINDKAFYACSDKCKNHLIKHYDNAAFVTDAFTGDTISKSGSLVGLKEKGKPGIIYFKNKQSFDSYYKPEK
jgi:hypothetical protein